MKRGFLKNKKAALYPKVESTAIVASSVSAPASSVTGVVATGEG